MTDADRGKKVAIPNFARPSVQAARSRASRACDACRQRKTKCDGARPTCEKCKILGVECSYSNVKRVQEKLELEIATSKVERYEYLLRSLLQDVDTPLVKKISKGLKVCTNAMNAISVRNIMKNQIYQDIILTMMPFFFFF